MQCDREASGGHSVHVMDVRGDGNCYYRCIWRIARTDDALSAALLLTDLRDEEAGMQQVRQIVAAFLRHHACGRTVVQGMLEFKRAAGADVTAECPLAAHLDLRARRSVAEHCDVLAAVVEGTNTMASSVEHELVKTIFAGADVGVVTLSRLCGESVADLADKWLRQLLKALAVVPQSRVCVLVNEDNIHYNYARLFGALLVDTDALSRHVRAKMESDSEDTDTDTDPDPDDR